jgi:flagellar basal body-associated protein FliL
MTALVIVLVVAAAAGLFALAWWSSGRSRRSATDPLAAGERAEAEANALKHYRPNSSAPLGPVG